MCAQNRFFARVQGYKMQQGDGFVTYTSETFPSKQTSLHRARVKGIQLHVSLDTKDEKQQNFSNAVDMIIPILAKYKVYQFNINYFLYPGREITINTFKEPRDAKEWHGLVDELTQTLAKNHITPGPLFKNQLQQSDSEIPGTAYVSYSDDRVLPDYSFLQVFVIKPLQKVEQPERPDELIRRQSAPK